MKPQKLIPIKLRMSDANRWVECSGSCAMQSMYPSEESKYAAEGTKAHAIAASMIDGTYRPNPADDKEMVECAYEYLEFIDGIRLTGDIVWELIEEKLNVAHAFNTCIDNSGFVDYGALISTTLHCADFKYGKGVKVRAKGDKQLLGYGICIADSKRGYFDKIVLHIFQPRAGGASSWEMSREEFEAERAKMLQAAADTGVTKDDPTKPVEFNPTPKGCQFCKAKLGCAKLEETAIMTVLQSVDWSGFNGDRDAIERNVRNESPERLLELLDVWEVIKIWGRALENRRDSIVVNGGELPGYKLVKGREGNRTYVNPQEIKAMVDGWATLGWIDRSEVIEEEVISPTNLLKYLKRNAKDLLPEVESRVVRPEGMPKVVRVFEGDQLPEEDVLDLLPVS